jgi:integrase/recombinase XerD
MTSSRSRQFSALLQEFFCRHLRSERNVSPRTVVAYRDCFRLLFRYVQERLHRRPSDLCIADLDASTVLAFLNHLEKDRHNCIRSRNTRLAAIRTFFQYAAPSCPESLPTIQRVLAIPRKRFNRPCLGFLSQSEIQAIIDAPNPSTWSGQRDRVMWATLYNTGARVSEIIALRLSDLVLDGSAQLVLHGKGRKERVIPLWKSTVAQLKQWLRKIGNDPSGHVFPNVFGRGLTRSGVEHRLRLAVAQASNRNPTLCKRHISPHTLRHTTAMHLLQSGVDLSVIALWLGHENPITTHMYLAGDIETKKQALEALQEPPGRRLRFRPSDKLLKFLEGL